MHLLKSYNFGKRVKKCYPMMALDWYIFTFLKCLPFFLLFFFLSFFVKKDKEKRDKEYFYLLNNANCFFSQIAISLCYRVFSTTVGCRACWSYVILWLSDIIVIVVCVTIWCSHNKVPCQCNFKYEWISIIKQCTTIFCLFILIWS